MVNLMWDTSVASGYVQLLCTLNAAAAAAAVDLPQILPAFLWASVQLIVISGQSVINSLVVFTVTLLRHIVQVLSSVEYCSAENTHRINWTWAATVVQQLLKSAAVAGVVKVPSGNSTDASTVAALHNAAKSASSSSSSSSDSSTEQRLIAMLSFRLCCC
jgi:hypothetical protein